MPDLMPFERWVDVAAAIIGAAILVGGVIWRTARLSQRIEDQNKATEEKFRNQGKRIGEAELECRAHETAIEGLRRLDQEHEFKLLALTDSHGEIKGQIAQLIYAIERQGEKKNAQEVMIEGRLARIEERLNLILEARNARGTGREP